MFKGYIVVMFLIPDQSRATIYSGSGDGEKGSWRRF